MQQGDQRHHLRPKTTWRDLGRACSTDGRLAVGTGDGRELVLDDERLNRRHLPDLLTENGTGGGQNVRQVVLTVRAGARQMDDQLGDLVSGQQFAMAARMARLGTALAPGREAVGRGGALGRSEEGGRDELPECCLR